MTPYFSEKLKIFFVLLRDDLFLLTEEKVSCSGKLKLDTEGVEIGHGKDVRYTREKLPWTSLLPP